MSRVLYCLPLVLSLAVAGCATRPTDQGPPGASGPGAEREQDAAPTNPPDLSGVVDPEPRWEPRSRWGNPETYEVFGVTYRVKDSAEGYRERGIASWYGTKFHGRRTSSGEPYDMYAMTAAHKHLPIPVYVRVTHLENGRQIIVRVNDRGPFVDNRIIDLSYAAAYRLGMLEAGTAPVEVEVIPVQRPQEGAAGGEPKPRPPVQASNINYFIQAGAFSERGNAERLQTRLRAAQLEAAVEIQAAELERRTMYRVRLGPVATVDQVDRISARLAEFGITSPQVTLQN